MAGDSKSREVTLESILRLLDRWRHLPAYQLERRVDVLFAMFLPRVLEERFGISNLRLIPEFPIKKKLLPAYRGDTTSQSINVDFLAVARVEDGASEHRAFLVELKTDMASKNEEQARDLGQAVEVGLKRLVGGVIEIARATSQKRKYAHLLYLLSELGLVELQDAPKVADRKEETWPSLELVYVQPRCPKMTTIGFNEFAEIIEEDGSGIDKLFARYLKEWTKDAGYRDPTDRGPC